MSDFTPYSIHYTVLEPGEKYRLEEEIRYYSPRYDKWITCPKGMISDGATCWFDMASLYWWVHDQLCVTMKWDDGTPCSRWQGSMVLGDIARMEKCYVAGTAGVLFTWLGGLF